MRNRREIVSMRPVKPAIFYRERLPFVKSGTDKESKNRYSQRGKVVLVKTIDLRENATEDDTEEEDEGNFFRRNRRKRDRDGEPVGKLRLRRKQDERDFESFDMDVERNRDKRGLDEGVFGQGVYDKMLGMKKSELLDKNSVNDLRRFTTEIGGPDNLAHHFNLRTSEINQIFPPEKREKKNNIKDNLKSQITDPDIRDTKNGKKMEVYTMGTKLNEKEKKMQKFIFTPLPYEIEEARSISRNRRPLHRITSRSQIPVRVTDKDRIQRLKEEMDYLLKKRTKSPTALTRVSQRIGKVKNFDKDKLMQERIDRMKKRDQRRNRVRRQADFLG